MNWEEVLKIVERCHVLLLPSDRFRCADQLHPTCSQYVASVGENEQDSSIAYTQADLTLNWKEVLKIVRDDDRFYLTTGKCCLDSLTHV